MPVSKMKPVTQEHHDMCQKYANNTGKIVYLVATPNTRREHNVSIPYGVTEDFASPYEKEVAVATFKPGG